jgi:hypothetical protein
MAWKVMGGRSMGAPGDKAIRMMVEAYNREYASECEESIKEKFGYLPACTHHGTIDPCSAHTEGPPMTTIEPYRTMGIAGPTRWALELELIEMRESRDSWRHFAHSAMVIAIVGAFIVFAENMLLIFLPW